MKKITIALIGAGGIGKIWKEAIGKVKNVEFGMVADISKPRAAEIASQFKNCEAVSDWRMTIKNKKIDAVIVATPHKWLAPIAYAALAAGKHVLCEKPGGIHAREVKRNIEMARKKRVTYMIGFNHRYHPAFATAKKLYEAGKIGEILFIRARHGFGGHAGYDKEWRMKKSISGGGELIDQGVHMIDMARWFMGNFKDVKGFAERLFWKGDVEDNGFALLRTARRRVASIHVSWTNWEWIHSFEIYGTKGYLVVDGLDQRYQGPERLTVGMRQQILKGPPNEKVIRFEKEQKSDSFTRQLGAFVAALNGKKRTIPQGGDAYEVLRIVERVYTQ